MSLQKKMSYEKLLNPKRIGKDFLELPQAGRSIFNQDYDRIVFCPTFRRLAGKTQVQPNHETSNRARDHIHNRLTHSIEVASVGRSLGWIVGDYLRHYGGILVEPTHFSEILQAACLAHDIGNPPLGHPGEDAIKKWFQDHPKYLEPISKNLRQDFLKLDGNAQGLRLLTQVEFERREGGLCLTYATLGALMKYPRCSQHPIAQDKFKFSVYQRQEATLHKIASALGLLEDGKGKGEVGYCRSPLAYLMEAADDICYAILDLEDWADALSLEMLEDEKTQEILKEVLDILSKIAGLPPKKGGEPLFKNRFKLMHEIGWLRARGIGEAIKQVCQTFLKHHESILVGEGPENLFDNEKEISPIIEAKKIARKSIYPKNLSDKSITTLLETFIPLAFEGKHEELQNILAPFSTHIRFEPKDPDDLSECYAQVLDVLIHLTDRELETFSQQFTKKGAS